MAADAAAVRYIVEWLQRNAQHVADVVVGPKREEWFNAESIVALWRHSDPDEFVIFGEQAYRSALEQTPFKAALNPGDALKIPDIVAYRPDGDSYSVPFVVEAKVLYRSEAPEGRSAALQAQLEQLSRAKSVCPGAKAVGILYLVSIVDQLGVDPMPFFAEVEVSVETIFRGVGITWLRRPAPLDDLRLRATSFAYPATTVSVGLAAFSW